MGIYHSNYHTMVPIIDRFNAVYEIDYIGASGMQFKIT